MLLEWRVEGEEEDRIYKLLYNYVRYRVYRIYKLPDNDVCHQHIDMYIRYAR